MHAPLIRAFQALLLAAALAAAGLTSAAAETAYSDQKLEAFVEAAVQVRKLSSEWQQRIAAADSEAQASELRDQAGQELVAAVEATDGISLQEYNQITEDARQDPELTARIREILDDKQTN